ncbi:YesL family protein [Clostridium beijerinckii]|uniref:YesL family protein n=1 Tax=Clostridium beijerinckii TaxID=1520 RepID=UPI00047EB298|nr:DUF624 domain-containing protein [Clostridium beijerinckii]
MKLLTPNFDREGPSVEKDEPEKEGIHLFFELFTMRFWDIIKLNCIFVLYSLPIITIGPALGAMTSILMAIIQRKHTYIFSDFHEAFKNNWKQSLVGGLIILITFSFLGISLFFYLKLAQEKPIFYLIFYLCLFITILLGLASMYIYPLLTTISLTLKDVFKNSILLCIVCIKNTLLCELACVLILGLHIFFFPISFPLFLILTFGMLSFISSFTAWIGIKRFIVQ